MSTTKLDKIAETELKIEQLKKQKAQYLKEHNAQVRKERNHRLCKRGGQVEKLLPGLAELTDEQFDTFVKKTLMTGFADRVLKGLMATDAGPADNAKSPAQENKTPANTQPNNRPQPNPSPAGKPA